MSEERSEHKREKREEEKSEREDERRCTRTAHAHRHKQGDREKQRLTPARTHSTISMFKNSMQASWQCRSLSADAVAMARRAVRTTASDQTTTGGGGSVRGLCEVLSECRTGAGTVGALTTVRKFWSRRTIQMLFTLWRPEVCARNARRRRRVIFIDFLANNSSVLFRIRSLIATRTHYRCVHCT